MSDYDEDEMPELASSPTLSATSDYEFDDVTVKSEYDSDEKNGTYSANIKEDEKKLHKYQDTTPLASSNHLTSDFSPQEIQEGNTDDITNTHPNTDENQTSEPNVAYFNAGGYIPIELNMDTESSVNNLDQISRHLERVSLYPFSTPVSSTSQVFRSVLSPTRDSSQRNIAQSNRPSAVIRPNVHLPSPVTISNQGTLLVAGPSGVNNGRVQKNKRNRTAFNTQQLLGLEREYSKARYVNRADRLSLAKELSLNERTIKVWFQNRRMKEKKDKCEGEGETEDSEGSKSEKVSEQNEGYAVNSQGNMQYTYYPIPAGFGPNTVQSSNLMVPGYPVYMPFMPQNIPPQMMHPHTYQQMPSPQSFQLPQPGYQQQRPSFPQQQQKSNFPTQKP